MTLKFLIIKLENQKQEAHLYCQDLTSLPQSCARSDSGISPFIYMMMLLAVVGISLSCE